MKCIFALWYIIKFCPIRNEDKRCMSQDASDHSRMQLLLELDNIFHGGKHGIHENWIYPKFLNQYLSYLESVTRQ